MTALRNAKNGKSVIVVGRLHTLAAIPKEAKTAEPKSLGVSCGYCCGSQLEQQTVTTKSEDPRGTLVPVMRWQIAVAVSVLSSRQPAIGAGDAALLPLSLSCTRRTAT
jgi:hypothetical protein